MERCILIGFILLYGTSLIGFSKGNCNLGIWGDQCSYECPDNCYNGSECTSNGDSCGCVKDTGDCYSCPKAYYGDRCQIPCGDNCSLSDQCLLSKQGCGCNKLSGHCNNCPKNLWGDFCERSCSDYCVNSECTRTHGNCSLGCTKGFYGTTCNVPCQSTCQYGCDQLSGQCLPSFCANCLGGLPKCDRTIEKCVNGCVDGFYGDSCDKSCQDVTGVNLCAKCTHLNILGAYVCLECQSGYFYDAISSPPPHLCKLCSLGCKVNSTTIVARCFPDTGNCRFGCSAGWSGSKCDTFTCSVSNCNSCVPNQPTECSSCQDGWYLESGHCIQCSDYCSASNVCDKSSGTCHNGCKNGWYGNKCIDNCTTNCLQGECNNTGVCLKGCNGKRYGQKCDLLCTNCLTSCNRSNGLCDSTCIDGFHGLDCNQPCPSNCLNNKCNKNDGKCSSGCKTGYYGVICQNACRSTCSGNICNFTTGACSGTCTDGNHGNYCDLQCPNNCVPLVCQKVGGACSSSCKDGNYGTHCNIPCPTTCSPYQCVKSTGSCSAACPSGKYGNACELSCSSTCNGTSCGRTYGECLDGCKVGFYGGTCQQSCTSCDSLGCSQISGECIGKCLDGFYGNNCDQDCSLGCINRTCDRTGKCSPCKEGYFGEKCSNLCDDTCKFSRCDSLSGKCSEGCIAGHYGEYCNEVCASCTVCDQVTGMCDGCSPGYYGVSCEKNCSSNCALASSGKVLCDKLTGSCLSGCIDGWYGFKCDTACNNFISCIGQACDRGSGDCSGNCVTGWYGSKCNLKCSLNCFGELCDRSSGVCTYNCTSGYQGPTCTNPCPNTCTECERLTSICTKCKPQYYGQFCSNLCSSHCLLASVQSATTVCNKITGACVGGCVNGWYGQTCMNQCSDNCLGNRCNITSGQCTDGCINDKYGQFCENLCTNCGGSVSGNCAIDTGVCLLGCDDGYYGAGCTQLCHSGCKNGRCRDTKHNCYEGCQNGLFGTSCEKSCNSNCFNNVCDQNTGRCLQGCNPGWFGNTCKYTCPDNCAGSVCDRVTGTCVDVCAGNKCEGSTVKDESEVDIAVIIGATFAAVIALMIIILIICCHCYRVRNKRKGGSADILTPRSDSLDGIDNRQFATFDELKKDDWVLRSSTARYEDIKQNGVLITRLEADAPMDYYNIPPPPPADYDTALHVQSSNDPAPPEPHLNLNIDGRNGIQVEMLPQYIEYMLHRQNAFEEEYNGLPQGLQHPHDVALKPGNKLKNRYKNIYAYDHSRVILVPELESSDDESSTIMKYGSTDYINASFFDGYHDPKAYISCQGPTDEMVNDFWRMIWQLRIQSIVMLTNVVESGQIKCKKYWPDENRTEKFGNFYVRFDYQEIFADFILTNLVVTKDDNVLETRGEETDQKSSDNARLSVKHFQFTSWPDKDVPQYVTPLVEYYFKVKSMHRDGPLLVHCSAGVGRSGTFIGLDYLMDQADQEGLVNIYKCVEKMRIARPNMVQTPDQYIFLHQALSEALLTSESPVDEEEFENYFNQMQLTDAQSGLTRLQNEFNQLKSQKVKHKYEAANTKENEHRNRRKDILASDECRVFLWSKIKGCTDYVNAIYLPSFRNKYCFIATEMPQCSTIIDICRMIFQEEVRTIVMLDNETSGIQATEHYWPNTNQTMECGPFSIKVTEEKHDREYTVRSLSFKFHVDDQKGTYKVNQFHYKGWSEGKVTPKSVDSFLTFVRAVTDWQSDSVKHPIIVHCLDGATKVGLFCLVRACCDRLQSDGEVSVIHTLHHMRARRQQLVPNFEQYKFCHECILQQINLMDT